MSLQALIITGQPTDTSNTENTGTFEELILSPGTSTNTLECNDQRRAAEAFNNNPTSPVAAIAIVACFGPVTAFSSEGIHSWSFAYQL
ncbi:hypothetical protein PABG_12145 [Paracoccidioides brasiliensis Pb03]|nr:hypothetical protein PABG_12145 [Paracoccidioides brasiliensis Pb03]